MMAGAGSKSDAEREGEALRRKVQEAAKRVAKAEFEKSKAEGTLSTLDLRLHQVMMSVMDEVMATVRKEKEMPPAGNPAARDSAAAGHGGDGGKQS